jgi:hypothetical protein
MNDASNFLMARLNEKGTHLLTVGGVFCEVCCEDAAGDIVAEVPVRFGGEALEEPDVFPDHDLEGAEHVVLLKYLRR